MGYDFINPEIMKYCQALGLAAPLSGPQTLAVYPLLFEPGEGWEYSYSIDWAGVVVERLGGDGRLEEYMAKNIWEPLGITAATFRLDEWEDIRSSMVGMLSRDEHGHLQPSTQVIAPHTFGYDAGGSGLYIKPVDYAKLLASLLRNDGVVLKKETVDLMFTPQLPDSRHLVASINRSPPDFRYAQVSALPAGIELNWGLGGLLTMQDVPGKRKKHSLSWGGLPNLQWWIDRSIYGLYATQIQPFGDVVSNDIFSHFEEALYKEVDSQQSVSQ